MAKDKFVIETDDSLEYPFSVFPSDLLRRVIAHLPHWLSEKEIDETNAYFAESYKDQPHDAPVWRVSRTIEQLKNRLDEDAYAVVDDEVDSPPRNYTLQEIEEALNWHIGKEYVEQLPDGDYRMTEKGLWALNT